MLTAAEKLTKLQYNKKLHLISKWSFVQTVH